MNENRTIHTDTIPPEALAALGTGQVVYVKPVRVDGVAAFAIHGADGRPLAVLESHAAAIAAAVQHDMQPVSVH